MLKTKIIVSDITNLTDARYFAAWGAEAMGFDLNVGSPSFSSPMQLNALREWISGPKIIGEFSGLQEKSEVDELIVSLQLDIVQLGPFAPKNWNFGCEVYREITEENVEDLAKADAYIYKGDAKSLSDPDWIAKINKLCTDNIVYIDISLTAEELTDLESQVNPEGFVLRGGEEEKVGYKSYDELDEIMEALEVD